MLKLIKSLCDSTLAELQSTHDKYSRAFALISEPHKASYPACALQDLQSSEASAAATHHRLSFRMRRDCTSQDPKAAAWLETLDSTC